MRSRTLGGSAASHLIPVRLTDIPLDRRMMAARIAAKTCGDDTEASEVLYAALFPSERTYWVRSAAVDEALAA